MDGDAFARSPAENPSSNGPPTPPSRQPNQDAASQHLSSNDERGRTRVSEQWRSFDPRSSSTQSLRPPESTRDGRRTLLIIYIHGFLGNDMSFQSFPAHVHNLLTILVSETHIVHTKIYPRYKSRKAIDFARDDFSEWLEPHETPFTDVVLLGHSMGGILAAEVVLLPPQSPATGEPLRHRILGIIGFDTPYLGMHPGVIVSGIGSLFRPAQEPPTSNDVPQIGTPNHNGVLLTGSQSDLSMTSSPEPLLSERSSPEPSSSTYTLESIPTSLSLTESGTSSMSTIPSHDPCFDPPFPNDKRLTERKGWDSVRHFINKHSDSLTSATKQYFMSHLEFGGCLLDYPGLRNRYSKIRALEDVDDIAQPKSQDDNLQLRRARFVNYWTASTGIRKKAPVAPSKGKETNGYLTPEKVGVKDIESSEFSSPSLTPTPSISVEDYSDGKVTKHVIEEAPDPLTSPDSPASAMDTQEMSHIDSIPIEEDYEPPKDSIGLNGLEPEPEHAAVEDSPKKEPEPLLPPIPPVPDKPSLIDLTTYTDKDSRKMVEREQKRIMKAYQQAIRDREIAIKGRLKQAEKREKKARQERDKQLKSEQKMRLKEEREEDLRNTTVNPPPLDKKPMTEKPKRDKKFCMVPSEVNGKKDKCWVRVYMEGVDEVGAHCGLFFLGPQYESLVGDVGARIEGWVKDDATRRLILEGEMDDQ